MPEFRTVAVGELSLRVAVEGEGPLVLMVHGFPESWFSWRHQMGPVAAAGFTVNGSLANDLAFPESNPGGLPVPQAVTSRQVIEMATNRPVTMVPISRPPRAATPEPGPIRKFTTKTSTIGTRIGSSDGTIISLIAALVSMSTASE